ncbi:hypothetical protein HY734_02915 [Candidatus Uhrbacteria bacterium]|nr:hypothetical protein [Candidatus Uhrbacteria bacterium]
MSAYLLPPVINIDLPTMPGDEKAFVNVSSRLHRIGEERENIQQIFYKATLSHLLLGLECLSQDRNYHLVSVGYVRAGGEARLVFRFSNKDRPLQLDRVSRRSLEEMFSRGYEEVRWHAGWYLYASIPMDAGMDHGRIQVHYSEGLIYVSSDQLHANAVKVVPFPVRSERHPWVVTLLLILSALLFYLLFG